MPKVQSISKSNFAWNSLRKEHHIAHVAEKQDWKDFSLRPRGFELSEQIIKSFKNSLELDWALGN